MSTRYYDPNLITIVVMGIPIDSGFAEDEMCTLEREGDAFFDVAGVDGEVSRSKSKDDRATFTLKLMQTSPNNDLLTALYAIDKAADNGAGVGPFALKDRNGTTLLAGEHSWIMAPPSVTMANKATAREWKIRIAKLIEYHGSNSG